MQAPVLVAELARRIGKDPFILIAGEDHDSRSFTTELGRHLASSGLAPQFQFTCRPADEEYADLVRRTLASQPAALMILADATATARFVRDIRSAGFQGLIFGGPWMGRRQFVDQAGEAAEGVIFPLLVQPGEQGSELEAVFKKQFQHSPDYAAVSSYDAVELLVAAIRKAGLNRARIGDALRSLAPWHGAAGTISWDTLGGNTRPPHLATISAGRIVELAPGF